MDFMKKVLLKKLLLLGEITFGLILSLVIVVSVFPLVPPFKNYYHSRTVLTGSMEPTIPKGSVVINQWADQKNLKVGDVITYQHPVDKKIIYITHRIVKIDKTGLLWRFETKGDANPASDFGLVTQAGTEGKVILIIPLVGYLIEFFKTPAGFILLIVLPLLIFIIRQTRDVLQLWPKRVIPQKKDAPIAKKRKSRKTLTLMLVVFAFLAARVSFVTYGSFTSGQATITGVTLSTAASFGSVPLNISHFIGTPGSPNQKKATVSWDTNEPATSNLKWRTNPADPWTILTEDTTADNTSHSRNIDGLLPETTYSIEVESADSAGNLATSLYSFATSSERSGAPWADQVVLNEFLPNPIGDDNALMTGGEWVEIYNKSDTETFNLTGWYLTDADGDGHKLYMTLINTITFDPATSGLNIGPHEFFVIYRNNDPTFDLDNSFWGDEVDLYSSTDLLVDQHFYSVAFGDEVLENKSFARFPDGTNNWFDPIPSPGRPNVLEVQPWPTLTPSLEFSLRGDKKAVSFTVSNINAFEKINYEIVYDSNNGEKGIAGSVDLSGETAFSRNDLLLGSCSGIEGKVCVYDEGITKLHLKVTLVSGGVETVLEKEIDY